MRDDLGYEYVDPSRSVIKKTKKRYRSIKDYFKNITIIKNGESYIKCHYCNFWFTIDSITKDHVVPVSKGGESNAYNLVPSCFKCNNEKGDMSYSEYSRKKGMAFNI